MLDPVIVVLERTPRVVWRIDEHALHLPGELLLQRLQREQVVPLNEHVVEPVAVAHPLGRVVRQRRIFHENPRFQPRPLVLANPCKLQLLLARHSTNPVVVLSPVMRSVHPCRSEC